MDVFEVSASNAVFQPEPGVVWVLPERCLRTTRPVYLNGVRYSRVELRELQRKYNAGYRPATEIECVTGLPDKRGYVILGSMIATALVTLSLFVMLSYSTFDLNLYLRTVVCSAAGIIVGAGVLVLLRKTAKGTGTVIESVTSVSVPDKTVVEIRRRLLLLADRNGWDDYSVLWNAISVSARNGTIPEHRRLFITEYKKLGTS